MIRFLTNVFFALILTMVAVPAQADSLSIALTKAFSTNTYDRGSDASRDGYPGSIEKGQPGYSNGATGPVEIGADGTVTEIGCNSACESSRDDVNRANVRGKN